MTPLGSICLHLAPLGSTVSHRIVENTQIYMLDWMDWMDWIGWIYLRTLLPLEHLAVLITTTIQVEAIGYSQFLVDSNKNKIVDK